MCVFIVVLGGKKECDDVLIDGVTLGGNSMLHSLRVRSAQRVSFIEMLCNCVNTSS